MCRVWLLPKSDLNVLDVEEQADLVFISKSFVQYGKKFVDLEKNVLVFFVSIEPLF